MLRQREQRRSRDDIAPKYLLLRGKFATWSTSALTRITLDYREPFRGNDSSIVIAMLVVTAIILEKKEKRTERDVRGVL